MSGNMDGVGFVVDKDTRAKERVEDLRYYLAKIISGLVQKNSVFKFECEEHNWNDETYLTIEEALTKLGEALADLTLWYDQAES